MFAGDWQLMIDFGLVEAVAFVYNDRTVEVFEYVHDATSVPVVCHTATIVNVTCRIFEHFVGRFRIFHQEHFQLTKTDSQVAVGELVRYVKAQRTELATLKCHAMEQAKREEQMFEYLDLFYHF